MVHNFSVVFQNGAVVGGGGFTSPDFARVLLALKMAH